MTAHKIRGGAGRRPTPEGISTRSLSSAAHRRQESVELLDRSPPADPWAERAAVASILLDPRILPEVAALLDVEHLADPICRAVYGAILRLHGDGAPADATLIVRVLVDRGLLDDPPHGDEPGRPVMVADLHELLHLLPTAAHWQWYVRRVLTVARRRTAIERGVQIIRAAHRGDDNPLHVSPAIERATRHAIEQRKRRGGKGGAA